MSGQPPLVPQNPRIPLWKGPSAVVSTLFSEWYLIRNLVKKDFRGRYDRAIIGYGWTFLEPFLLSAVYYALFTIIAGRPEPYYALHVIIGVIVWGHFGKSLQATVASLSKGSGLIKQVYFPREILAIYPALTQLWISCIALTAIIPVMIYLEVMPTANLWMVPAGLVLATMLAVGLGMLFAPLNAISQDVTHLFRFIVRAGFFVSPVMWTYEMMLERAGPEWVEVIMLNPMVIPITIVRHGIDGSSTSFDPMHIGYAVGMAAGLMLLGTAVFKRWESRVVKYL